MNPGRLLIWGYDFSGNSNMIEVYGRYLRLKLEAHSANRLILTVNPYNLYCVRRRIWVAELALAQFWKRSSPDRQSIRGVNGLQLGFN